MKGADYHLPAGRRYRGKTVVVAKTVTPQDSAADKTRDDILEQRVLAGSRREERMVDKYNRLTRWLHLGIALGVTLQMMLSLVMEAPEPRHPVAGLEASVFEVHESVGLLVFGLLLLHWLFLLSGHIPLGMGHLFPWFSRQKRTAMVDEIKQQWGRRRLDDTRRFSAVAGATHGLGLLATGLMAITGVIIYFGMAENGAMPPLVDAVKEVHEGASTLMWVYLIGHAGIGVVHQWLGHRTLSDMFDLRK